MSSLCTTHVTREEKKGKTPQSLLCFFPYSSFVAGEGGNEFPSSPPIFNPLPPTNRFLSGMKIFCQLTPRLCPSSFFHPLFPRGFLSFFSLFPSFYFPSRTQSLLVELARGFKCDSICLSCFVCIPSDRGVYFFTLGKRMLQLKIEKKFGKPKICSLNLDL